MITKTIHNNKLFVWWNGRLIYKRYLSLGYGLVIDEWFPAWNPRHAPRDR